MTYKYKINKGYGFRSNIFPEIEKVEIKKETPHTVLRTYGHREYKESEYHKYFDTWKEAHDFIIEGIKKEIRYERKQLREKINKFKKAKSLIEE